MLRIRFHGRGGQGIKTAGRILGSALFGAGYEVQDAPRYAAERRGAPIFAYVRADRRAIHERGVIDRPDLVVVADESLVPLPGAGVLAGVDARTTLLLASAEAAEVWRSRLNFPGEILVVPVFGDLSRADVPLVGVACAGAAGRLLGLPWQAVEAAVRLELGELGEERLWRNLKHARDGFDGMAAHAGRVVERPRESLPPSAPGWIELPFEGARVSAPAIHAAATSVEVRTGLWRLLRPVVDAERCRGCWWVCSSMCPDGVIAVHDGRPVIDYDHCKGCMVCVSVCPHHAIDAVPERGAMAEVGP